MTRRTTIRYDSQKDTNFGSTLYKTLFLSHDQEQETCQALQSLTWSKVEYPMYGNIRKTPRSTWCFGRLGQEIVYYRGKSFMTELFPEWLEKIRLLVEETIGFKANACILNLYKEAENHITWHADDEKFLEEKTVVSLSFGHPREFHTRDKLFIHKICLENNSILVMKDGTEHTLPASKSPVKPRYNITLRRVASEKGMGNYYYYNRGSNYFLENKVC